MESLANITAVPYLLLQYVARFIRPISLTVIDSLIQFLIIHVIA